jgi:hypothetical protein
MEEDLTKQIAWKISTKFLEKIRAKSGQNPGKIRAKSGQNSVVKGHAIAAPVMNFSHTHTRITTLYLLDVRGHCMFKGMPVIPVNRVVDKKRIIGKNGGPRRRRGTRGC